MKTYLPKNNLEDRQWRIVDADGKVLGRLAVQIADTLRGKDKPTYTPHLDTGDFVIVVNAEKVALTGKKEEQKKYMFFSGWRGSEKFVAVSDMRANHPDRIIRSAVKGMLPKNRLGRKMLTKLKVYKGPKHEHDAQKPTELKYIR